MKKWLFLFMLSFMFSCAGQLKTEPVPVGWRCPDKRITIAIENSFFANERKLIYMAILRLKQFGVYGRIVSNPTEAQVVVRYWKGHECSDNFLGIHWRGSSEVFIDTTCAHTETRFQAVVMHELLHWLGMYHICRPDGKTSDSCSDVGKGPALLNPFLNENISLEPSTLDLVEYNRACWKRQGTNLP